MSRENRSHKTEDIANVVDRVFKVEYTHNDPRSVRFAFSKAGEIPDLFPCDTGVPGMFQYFIRYERKECAARVMELDLKSYPGMRVYPVASSVSLAEQFRTSCSISANSEKRKRDSEQETQGTAPHRPNAHPKEELHAPLPKRPRTIPANESRRVPLGDRRMGNDSPRCTPNAWKARAISPSRRALPRRPSDGYPTRARSPLWRVPRRSLDVRPTRASPPLPRNALPPRPRSSPLRDKIVAAEVQAPLCQSAPPGKATSASSQDNHRQQSAEPRPAGDKPESQSSASPCPAKLPVKAEAPSRPTQPSPRGERKLSSEGNIPPPSLGCHIVVTVNGQTIVCDLGSNDPQTIIDMLRDSQSERGNWMTAGAYFRRIGKTQAAIAIIYAMLEVMAKAGVEDHQLKPAFLLLSGCELDLALGAKAKGDITTSKYHYMNVQMWLHRVYGQIQTSTVVQPEPSVPMRSAPSRPEQFSKQKTARFWVGQYKRKDNVPCRSKSDYKKKAYAIRQYHEKMARQRGRDAGGYKEKGFRTEGRFAGNNENRKDFRM